MLGNRFQKHSIAWYLILAVCVFPLLGAHVHAFDPHHGSSPHPWDQGLHSHQHADHDSIDRAAAPNNDDTVVELGGESLLQQVIKIFQYAVLFAFLPAALTARRFSYPSNYVAPVWLRPPSRSPCQPRAPPAV